jgi:galactose oxidase-like protein/Kelch motif protein
MRELDDAALERRLRGVLEEHLGALPFELTVDALDRRREARGRRFGRGRGMTLLAAAALLLVGGALAAGSGLVRLPSVEPPVPEPSVIAVATASPDATSPTPSESAAPSASPIPVAGPGGVWIPTGSMVTPRDGHSAVRLLDGRVLVVGGSGDESEPATAELYDPVSGTWSATGSMLKRQAGFPPALLLDGRVLVGDSDDPAGGVVTIGSEVYDPESGTWSSAGKVVTSEFWAGDEVASGFWGADGYTATLLREGKVLVAGISGTRVYDPDSGTWSATGTMIAPRYSHTATLLRDSKVFVAGGWPASVTNKAELYDPDTGSWTAIANTPSCAGCGGGSQWATLLQDGTLLNMRGEDGDGPGERPVWEIYDPTTGTWTELAEPTVVGQPKALLPDDTVLLAVEGPPCTAAATYNPRSGSWTSASSMLRCESKVGFPGSFTPLLDGTVLVAGGPVCNNDESVCAATGATELYVPAGVPLPPLPAFPSPAPPVFPSPTPLPTPLPPAAGPIPPNARSWTVTVDNQSSEPATLFVAGDGFELVGSATPNVVPAGTTAQVTFLFPANDDGWIHVNPRPGDEGGLVNADQIGIPGKILVRAEGDAGWLSP